MFIFSLNKNYLEIAFFNKHIVFKQVEPKILFQFVIISVRANIFIVFYNNNMLYFTVHKAKLQLLHITEVRLVFLEVQSYTYLHIQMFLTVVMFAQRYP